MAIGVSRILNIAAVINFADLRCASSVDKCDASAEDIEAAARQACCHDDISKLPRDYISPVGVDGCTLLNGAETKGPHGLGISQACSNKHRDNTLSKDEKPAIGVYWRRGSVGI
jgi:hypothetical protein